MNKKSKLIKDISKFITSFVTSTVLSYKINQVMYRYCKNLPLTIIITIASSITAWTLTDVLMYLIEKAYENGELTLAEAANILSEIKDNKG